MPILPVLARDEMCQSGDWQPTRDAWVDDDTDANLAGWWQDIQSSPGSHTSFANELGKSFGPQINGFECGIGDEATCSAPGCEGMIACMIDLPREDRKVDEQQIMSLLGAQHGHIKPFSLSLTLTRSSIDYLQVKRPSNVGTKIPILTR